MAEENKGRGYCPTYGEDNDSLQSDVAISMENGGTTESEKPLEMSTKSNEAEKAKMMQWCNEIKKSCTFGCVVFLFLTVVSVLSFLFYVLFW